MTALPFCVCGCGRRVPAQLSIDGWRSDCAVVVLREVRGLQSLPPDDLGMLVAFLRDRKARVLANTITGCIPMDGERDR